MRTDPKFRIELPHTVKRALDVDEETETTFWIVIIRKEMIAVTPLCEFLDKGINTLVGHQKIFDVKMDFTRKARFVAVDIRPNLRHPLHMRALFRESVLGSRL
jgi:hypothetical protein